MELYCWWHAEPSVAEAALLAVQAFQHQLTQTDPGTECHLLQRAEPAAGRVTVMEIYRHPDGLNDQQLDALAARASAALGSWAAKGRHEERFEPFAPGGPA